MGSARVSAASALVAVLAVLTAACDSGAAGDEPAKGAADTPSPVAATPPPVSAEDFHRQAFTSPTLVDNQWSPLRPGTRFEYVGSARDGADRIARHMIVTVTNLTKNIGDVRTVVIWTTDFDDGQLSEDELAFQAQDDDGNLWHIGEYPEEYDNGKLDKVPAWINGVAGATAGIAMEANPRLGNPDYAQGFAPAPINWADRSRNYKTGQRTCVPAGCYDDVLVVEEYEADKPGAAQLKYYAPGVGLVRVGWTGPKEKEREVLVLKEVRQLSATETARARTEALKVERRAYRISKDVYGTTPPSQ